MHSALSKLSAEEREKLEKKPQPREISPMLATLTENQFSDPAWIFERKFDGERCIVAKEGSTVRLLSRNQNELSSTYPELNKAIAGQKGSFVADGEIVAFDGQITSFSRLQQRMQIRDREQALSAGVPVVFYLFDLLHLDGHSLEALPLRTRKQILRDCLEFTDPLRYTKHRDADGEGYYREACKSGWEGLIAKEAESAYVHSRSKNWLKFKCVRQQEFVICGFTEPKGNRAGFGAIIVGYRDGQSLLNAGRVGTGFDDGQLHRLRKEFDKLARETPPFTQEPHESGTVHWLEPELVAEIRFTEWTEGGKLRHPRFLGIRNDKNPEDVVREMPR